MSPFTLSVLCIQACLIQSAMSNCIRSSSSTVKVLSSGSGGCRGFGGQGPGAVSAAGDVKASGSSKVVGTVPVKGTVKFSGRTQATGATSITGQCKCGCQ